MEATRDRRMFLLLPSAFMNSLSIGVVNLGMLFLVKERYAASPAAVGWFAASWSMAYLAGCLGLRFLQKLLPAGLSMALACFGSAAIFLGHLLFPSLASAFVCYTLYGFLTALFWPRLMGWLSTGLEGKALGNATGAFNLSWSAGGIVSPYLSGLLTERSLTLPVIVSICSFAATGGFILIMSRLAPSPALSKPAGTAEGEVAAADGSTPLRFPAWVGVFALYAFIAVFFNIFPLYGKDVLGLSESKIGLVLLIRAAATAVGFWFFGRCHFWHFKRVYLLLVALAALCLDLFFALTASPLLTAVGVAAAGFVLAAAYTNSIFYGASGARDRERRMTIHESSLTAGQVFGSVAGGAIYQAFSWSALFWAFALLLGAALGIQAFLLGRRR